MKKILQKILVVGTLAFFAVILIFSRKNESVPTFKERHGPIALSAEWLNTKAAIQGLLDLLRQKPDDSKAMMQLAQAYIQEARITGDHAYYDKASLDLLDQVLKKEPGNFEALCCKSTVLLSQHHFSDGLTVAQQAVKLNPYNAFIYGLLCDANVELGNYDEAIKMADKMVSLRPDIRSYSRVSYLREIFGDLEGAKQAMKLAVSAGFPGLEQTEWTRMILAHLYECSGELDSAEMQCKIALQERPDYPFAIAGIGRIQKERGNYNDAIKYYEKAKDMITEYSFSDELTDLYLLNNEKERSQKIAQTVIDMLSPNSNAEGTTGHGHYADRELAYAYLKTGDLDNALLHAQIEYERRPKNIDVCEMMGWVKYKRGEYAEANMYISQALHTGSKNPQLLCRAGMIKLKCGEKEYGLSMIKNALNMDPFLDPFLKKEASQFLSGTVYANK
ncbi:MAG TPA: transposase [Bacteroidia bacterium]|jgi:tetratricopeptide (TPR) repeat protein